MSLLWQQHWWNIWCVWWRQCYLPIILFCGVSPHLGQMYWSMSLSRWLHIWWLLASSLWQWWHYISKCWKSNIVLLKWIIKINFRQNATNTMELIQMWTLNVIKPALVLLNWLIIKNIQSFHKSYLILSKKFCATHNFTFILLLFE